jgi:hypothetical protein
MKKLVLDLNSLSVETFAPVAARPAQRGTVRGNEFVPADHEDVGLNGESYDAGCSYGCTGEDRCLMATLPPACI